MLRAPLCPAGHLPHKGGDQLSRRLFANHHRCRTGEAPKPPISPQVGEMSGRTEGRRRALPPPVSRSSKTPY
ncbi:hypothetical protein DPM33_18345 [Mesorhizobium hawassense]|uniref:Lytic murein transglycosylase n=1 Tax=Mesorhizobium hawassense TaxID=1209954 RepID=A0A330HSE6_9HYPH|nr:hypothetical protein DPM33_18345 [Mesorhizobium hawassense]